MRHSILPTRGYLSPDTYSLPPETSSDHWWRQRVVVTERISGVATVTPSVVLENVGTLDRVEVGGIIPRPGMGGGKFL